MKLAQASCIKFWRKFTQVLVHRAVLCSSCL